MVFLVLKNSVFYLVIAIFPLIDKICTMRGTLELCSLTFQNSLGFIFHCYVNFVTFWIMWYNMPLGMLGKMYHVYFNLASFLFKKKKEMLYQMRYTCNTLSPSQGLTIRHSLYRSIQFKIGSHVLKLFHKFWNKSFPQQKSVIDFGL